MSDPQNILPHSCFLCFNANQMRPEPDTKLSGRAHVFSLTDLSQNMPVERDCRAGRYVYEASIQIFKHTLLEKESSDLNRVFGFDRF